MTVAPIPSAAVYTSHMKVLQAEHSSMTRWYCVRAITVAPIPSAAVYTSHKFSSVRDDIYALGKAHMLSTLSLSFPNIVLETVSMLAFSFFVVRSVLV